MRRLFVALPVLGAALALATPARAALPPCTPAQGGTLERSDVEDPTSRGRLYATHRLRFDLSPSGSDVEEPDGTRYPFTGPARLSPGPGVVAPLIYVNDTPGTYQVPVEWDVEAGRPDQRARPLCTGSARVAVTLARPRPTPFVVKRNLIDAEGNVPRLTVNIAGGRSDDLRPVTVRIRRRGSRARNLFTLPLAAAGLKDRAGYLAVRNRRRFAGMTITSGPREATLETKGLVTVGVKIPKARVRRRIRRAFTLEVVRGSRTLLAVRAAFSCRGYGSRFVFQSCRSPRLRVKRG